ncbi:MAG TPA: hypothetical protein VKT77_10515 [Chthonomonadaceae bacterium]|nr:hypothetical protein [Chthonomonadaceae bacterium]
MSHVPRKRSDLRLLGRLLAATLPLFAATPAPGHAAPPPKKRPTAAPARKGRETVIIDDAWRFCPDPGGTGETAGWPKSPPSDAKPVAVPSTWPAGGPAVGWYFRDVEPPASWRGQTVRLCFGAVAERANVWLNGDRVGGHDCGATPFDINVTKSIKIGAKNRLAIRVEGIPSGTEGRGRWGGIWQDVALVAHDEAYISDVFPYGGPLGNLRVDVELLNTSDKSGDASLDARVLPSGQSKPDIKATGQILSLTPKRNETTMLVNVARNRLTAWSPESPALYDLELVFHQDADVLDKTRTTFGFRELEWSGGQIQLNGVPFKADVAGASHAPAPMPATPQELSAARDSLRALHGAGTSAIYLDAPHPALLATADEIGLAVIEGPRAGQPAIAATAELLALVRRDRSHPCVLAWDIRALGDDAAAGVRKLDRTRFVIRSVGGVLQIAPPHTEELKFAAAPAGLTAH